MSKSAGGSGTGGRRVSKTTALKLYRSSINKLLAFGAERAAQHGALPKVLKRAFNQGLTVEELKK